MGASLKPDFSGWVTKHNLKCSDGRTIRPGAFAHQDKTRVPLVFQHQHSNNENVLGYVELTDKPEGVWGDAYTNDTPNGKNAKIQVEHGDIVAFSIYANQLQEEHRAVLHGNIREVSLVLSGANPGALIENINVRHSDGGYEELDDEALIVSGEEFQHTSAPTDKENTVGNQTATVQHAEGKTVGDVVAGMSQEQKDVLYYLIAEAKGGGKSLKQSGLEDDEDEDDENDDDLEDDEDDENDGDAEHSSITHSQEGTTMTRNVFEDAGTATGSSGRGRATLTHDQLTEIVGTAKRIGSFKDAFLAHAVDYGIENIDLLFPDAKAIQNTPELIARQQAWVSGVLSGTRKSPFSRIKTLWADVTHEEARAKGYIKGSMKKEEWFGIAKRLTTPTTIYKKQKLDRDDMIDITDLDVVAWLKGEMRLMLNEEIARAILVGDGREVDDPDKVRDPAQFGDGAGIRSIANDHEFFSHKVTVPVGADPDTVVETILRSRKHYKGSGNPTMYCTEDLLTDLILSKDKMGRRQYQTQAELESGLRVSGIVTVPVMESRSVNGGDLLAVLVNMSDYTVGTDRGGEVSMFDDFDIDFNQFKYLIEGRMSGGLTGHKTAMVYHRGVGILVAVVEVPTFNASTGVVTIPAVTGVTYRNADTLATMASGPQPAIAAGTTIEVEAVPAAGYYFAENTDNDWTFTRPAA